MDKYLIPSVTHACQIFRILAASSQGMTMHDIEQQLDLPRTTLFRLLRTLCHEQMLEKKGKIYRCGNELTRLGLHMINADHMHQLAIPHIQRLALKSGHTAHLAVPNNGKVLIVEVVDSPNPLMVSKRPGGQAQMHCSSTGKVFLAFLYRENLDLYIAEHPLERHTAYTITDKASLEAELQRITALGYAVAPPAPLQDGVVEALDSELDLRDTQRAQTQHLGIAHRIRARLHHQAHAARAGLLVALLRGLQSG